MGEGGPRRRGPKHHGIRVTQAHGTHQDLDVARDLRRRIDTRKHHLELPLPHEPRHRVGKARVVSSADQPAATTNKQVDLRRRFHVRRMLTPSAYRAERTQSVDSLEVRNQLWMTGSLEEANASFPDRLRHAAR